MRLLPAVVAAAWSPLGAAAAIASTPDSAALVIDAGTHFQLKGATRLVLDCSLTSRGAFAPAAGSRVVVRGHGSPVLSGVSAFADLELASYGVAALANPAAVTGTLRLGTGRLSLAGHDLTVAAVTGGSATSYVVTPDTLGRLVRAVNDVTATPFPIGNAAYNPVTVRTGFGTDVFRVAALDDPPVDGLAPASHLARAWALASQGGPGTGGDARVTVQWNDGEQGPSFVRAVGGADGAQAWRWYGSAWVPQVGTLVADNGVFPAVGTLLTRTSGLWTLGGPTWVSAAPAVDAPSSLQFAPVWPNPLRGAATVRYGLPRRTHAKIEVYSVRGERVAVLAEGDLNAGWHSARIDSRGIASGVYFLRLEAGGEFVSSKVVVIR